MVQIACYSVKRRRFDRSTYVPSDLLLFLLPLGIILFLSPFTPAILELLGIKYTNIPSHVSPISLAYSLISPSLFSPFLLFSLQIKRSSTSSTQEPPASHRCQSLHRAPQLEWQSGRHVLDRAGEPVQRERAARGIILSSTPGC
jgi:hypothetical protein